MAEAIDYGAHAPASSGPIDYGAHSPASPDEAPGFLSAIGSDALSLLHAVRHPVQAAAAMANSSVEHGAAAIHGIKEGDARKVYDNAYQAVPGIGPMLWGIAQDLVAGNNGRAVARLAELAVPEVAGEYGPKIAETLKTSPTVRAAGAGLKEIVPAVIEHGNLLQPQRLLKAIPQIADAAKQEFSSATTDATAAAHRAANPPVAIEPPEPQPVADLTPIRSSLPSGRTPGPAPAPLPVNYIARPAPAWQQLPDQPQGVIPDAQPIVPADRMLPSGRRVPVPGQEPNPITSALDRAKLTVDARQAVPSVSPVAAQAAPLTAAQEIAQKFTGSPDGGSLPANGSAPLSDVQTLADQYHSRGDVPSPMNAAKKDMAIVEHMRGKGITAEVYQNLTPSQRASFSEEVDSGYKAPSKDPVRVADVVALLKKNPPAVSMTETTEANILRSRLSGAAPEGPQASPEMLQRLKQAGALKDANKLKKALQ